MKKTILLFVALSLFLPFSMQADEGMWLLNLLKKMNYEKMQEMGLQLSPEDIYSINQSSVKDAVVGLGTQGQNFNFSCTAELVSPQGLMFTNHHCGYSEIQEHSSTEHNYVDDGFWAYSKEEELPNPGKTATFLVRMEDVTDQIVPFLTEEMTEEERETKIKELSETIADNATKDSHYNATVKDFFKGNQFFLVVYETFLDVRLVGAPPSAIGKFGGDTDNWMWPRHTGDFCIFRVYSGPDGKPAEYSEDNIPLKSKHFFPVSIEGVDKNDFAMVLGYPGTTERYMTSWGVQETIENTNAIRVRVRTKKLNIIKEDMEADKEVYLKYTSKYNQSSNYWKYSIGQNKGLKRLKVIEQKRALEKDLQKWITAENLRRKKYSAQIEELMNDWKDNPRQEKQYKQSLEEVLALWNKLDSQRKEKYGDALHLIKEAYQKRDDLNYAQQYFYETMFEGTEVILFSYNGFSLYNTLMMAPDNKSAIEDEIEKLKESATEHFEDYNPPTDRKLFAAMLELYYKDVPEDYHPILFETILEEYDGDFEKYADDVFSQSVFTDKERMFNFLEKPDVGMLWNGSQVVQFAESFRNIYTLLKESPDKEEIIVAQTDELKSLSEEFFADFDKMADKATMKLRFKNFYQKVPKSEMPSIFTVVEQEFGGDTDAFIDQMFSKSLFTNPKKMEKFLKKPKLKKIEGDLVFETMQSLYPERKAYIIENDMAFQAMISILRTYFTLNSDESEAIDTQLEKGQRLFMAALMEMKEDKNFYPDANSTMRFTYGKVIDYYPADAVRYKYYTTLSGVIEKENPNDDEFIVPEKLKELYEKKKFGKYAENGDVRTCFITDNDITGGNSGSPVINGNGELIGIAFDGNWEAMSGDIAYEPSLQRTICVDIRYVLFIIDKFANAQNLIEELTITK